MQTILQNGLKTLKSQSTCLFFIRENRKVRLYFTILHVSRDQIYTQNSLIVKLN